jgi:hypothetical protein
MENSILDKKIIINGTNNKYQIKKLLKKPVEIKKRKEFENVNISSEIFTNAKQEEIIADLYNNENVEPTTIHILFKKHINKKINGYKHQDIHKNRFDSDKIINFKIVIECLHTCNLKCYYCKEKINVLSY